MIPSTRRLLTKFANVRNAGGHFMLEHIQNICHLFMNAPNLPQTYANSVALPIFHFASAISKVAHLVSSERHAVDDSAAIPGNVMLNAVQHAVQMFNA